jgi:hypothetical protein
MLFSQTRAEHGHEAQIVDGGQTEKQAIIDLEQVVQVATRLMRTTQAIADGRNRLVALDMFLVVDI